MRLTIKEREESMATGKALDGKPYAGNPHVRFDEGEVAPATTPRRGSLLYNREKTKVLDLDAERSSLVFLGYEFRKARDRLFGTGGRYLHFGPSPKSVKRVCREVHELTHSRNVLLPVETVVERVNRLLKGWGAFYSVGYPSRAFRKVNHHVLKRMARFLNRKSQRRRRLKFADTYYGEMTHYGLYRLAWADVRRARI